MIEIRFNGSPSVYLLFLLIYFAGGFAAIYRSIFIRPHYVGIPLFQGFIIALINREERIDDDGLIEYLRKKSKMRGIFSQ